MDTNIFIPRTQAAVKHSPQNEPVTKDQDNIGFSLLRVAQWCTVLVGAVSVVFFTPQTFASLHFDKAILAVLGIAVTVIALSLLVLRRRSCTTVLPLALAVFGGAVIAALISALFSGDVSDALFGTVLEVHTVGFLFVLLCASAIPLTLQHSKKMVQRFFLLGAVSALTVILFHVTRLVFGPQVLSFGTFTTATASPVGSFNDLAIFSGLVTIVAIITVLFIRLAPVAQGLVSVLAFGSIALMAIVNFNLVWYILGLFSLLTFIYLVATPVAADAPVPKRNTLAVALTGILCVVSVVFIIAGQPLSQWITSVTGTSYVEVRPSPAATLDIARGVYSDQLWLGVGPNRFSDAWRAHKDTSLNQTVFWDTDFAAGYGFIPTLFVTTGIIGGGLFVLFHLLFIVGGIRTLLQRTDGDQFWYYVASTSFAAALFIMIMSYIYVPSAALLLLGAFFTGLTFASYSALRPVTQVAIPLVRNQQMSFLFMAVSVVVILVTVYVVHGSTTAYLAARDVGERGAAATSTASPSQSLQFTRLMAEVGTLESLILTETPTEAAQQDFINAATNAISLSDELTTADPTNPLYHFTRARVYAYLALTGVEGALAASETSFTQAEALDPNNPKYAYTKAQLYFQIGDVPAARTAVDFAISLKRNYAEALFLRTQIDVAEGNTDAALTTAEALVTLEPNNPARYYQLGILYSAVENYQAAVTAFDQALSRNESFANARYFKALALIELDDRTGALQELKTVQATNQSNEELQRIISALETGGDINVPESPLPIQVPAESGSAAASFDDTESDLISPTNTPIETEDAPAEASIEADAPVSPPVTTE